MSEYNLPTPGRDPNKITVLKLSSKVISLWVKFILCFQMSEIHLEHNRRTFRTNFESKVYRQVIR